MFIVFLGFGIILPPVTDCNGEWTKAVFGGIIV